MKKFFSISGLLALCMLVMMPAVTSCDDDDKYNTEQYRGGVSLNAFGPSPVARGGELRFLGSGLDKITKVSIPGCDDITDIKVISANEIRVTVPQTAQPGTVTLHYTNGTIETKSMLTYLEPISIESIEPLRVKPGEELTINGEYLNLINEVCFAFVEDGDSVNVYADAFTAHERKQIKVIVPEEAISGTIYISDAKTMPNMIESEMEVEIVLPATTPLDLTGAKGGDVVTIIGTDLDLVRTILLPDGTELDFDYADGKITFILPENVSVGTIVMIPASGVKVACANIGVVVPTELEAIPATDLRADDILKVKGVNMDQVVSLTFPGVEEAVEPATLSATELTVAFPAMAQSGDLVLNLKSGKTVAVAISTAKPEAQAYDPATVPAAAEFTIKGKNLELVTVIEFAGDVQIAIDDKKNVSAATATEITMIAPATAQTGAVKLHMANGEVVECAELTIQAPECAYITVQPEGELEATGMFVATVANEDKLTGVTVNGQNVNFILNGGQLYFTLPQTCGKNTQVTLVSSNGEISYTYDVIPATHVGITIWTGAWDCGAWGGNQDLAWDGYDWTQVPAGAIMTLYMTPTVADGEWWCVSLRHGQNWGNLPDPIPGQYDTPADGILAVELTQGILDDLIANGGLVLTGQGYILSKVTLEWEISLEETIWTGSWENASWGGNQDLAWGGYDWSTVKAGQTLRLYCTPTVADGEWWCMDIRHGQDWGAICGESHQQDTPEGGVATYVLTQEELDDIVAGGGLVITGQGYILNKVTIE